MSTEAEHLPFDPDDRAARNERLHLFAHDLRNKLEGLRQAFQLARSSEAEGLGAQLDDMAERSYFGGASAIEALMNDLQVPRDPVRVDRVAIDLEELLNTATESISFRSGKKQQRFERAIAPHLRIKGDRHLMDQVLEAVLSNAIKFSPVGSVIHLRAEQEGDQALVNITDPGTGLTEQDLARIFERFAILGSRTTNGEAQNRGTLARAQRWAEVQGATITFTTAGPGTGTTCTLRLPLA